MRGVFNASQADKRDSEKNRQLKGIRKIRTRQEKGKMKKKEKRIRMNKEKQIKKVSKQRQEYLKFKPFADDLRKSESWCELDGVLNRYQTVKNLSKMGYRKSSDVAREIFEEIENVARSAIILLKFERNKNIQNIKTECYQDLIGYIAELKKKYTESEDKK